MSTIETLEKGKRCEICSKLAIITPERRHANDVGLVFSLVTLNEHISHLFLVFLLFTLNK